MSAYNQIYSEVTEYIKQSYSSVYCTSRNELIPESFPCVNLQVVSNYRPKGNATLSNDDNVNRVTFELQVYAELSADCWGITRKAEEKFKALSFFEESCLTVDNLDPKIQRVVARFSGLVTG